MLSFEIYTNTRPLLTGYLVREMMT